MKKTIAIIVLIIGLLVGCSSTPKIDGAKTKIENEILIVEFEFEEPNATVNNNFMYLYGFDTNQTETIINYTNHIQNSNKAMNGLKENNDFTTVLFITKKNDEPIIRTEFSKKSDFFMSEKNESATYGATAFFKNTIYQDLNQEQCKIFLNFSNEYMNANELCKNKY